MSARGSYNRGAQLTFQVVRGWPGEWPQFRFPPKEIALIADLRDIGDKLAINDSAKELVAYLIRTCVEQTGEAPTAMMLRVALKEAGIPVETCSPSELGLKVPSA